MLPSVHSSVRSQRQPYARFCLQLIVLVAMLTGAGLYAGTPPSVVYTGAMQVLPTGSYSVGYALSAMADLAGNVYMIDFNDNQVLVLSPSGTVSVLATPGYSLNAPYGLWVDNSGNVLIADSNNNRILKVTPAGTASVVNTGAYTLAVPQGVGEDSQGNIYIADTFNSRALKVAPGGAVTIISGVGNYPEGFAFDSAGDVYIGAYFAAYEVSSTNTVTTINTGSYSPGPWGVAVDSAGNLYIMDSAGDQVLRVDTLGNTTVVNLEGYTLSNPAGLTIDRYNNLYISDQNHARYLELSLTSAGFGQVPVGTTSATQTLNFTIAAGTTIATPAVLTTGTASLEFADAGSDTCTAGTYGSATNCVVNVTLTPVAPGLRKGAVVISDGSGNVLASVPLFGTGTGPQVAFGPNGAQTGVGTLEAPYGLATDASGNLFIADVSAAVVYKVTPGGTQTTAASGFSQPDGVAVDGAGNLYVADAGLNQIIEVTPTGAQTTVGSGFSSPTGVAVDGAENLYIVNGGNSTVYKLTPAGIQTTVGSGFANPWGVAVDAAGNVYVADQGGFVYKVTPGGTQTTVGSGFSQPYGVAVDAAGDVYVADINNGAFEVTPSGTQTTFSGTNLFALVGVALDGAGDIFFASNAGPVTKINQASASTLSFSTPTNDGSTDTTDGTGGTITEQVFNIGNLPLSFSAIAYPADFSEPAGDLQACAVANSLAAAAECDIPVQFTPQNAGAPLVENVTLTDNNLNGSNAAQTIGVTGTGVNVNATHFSVAAPASVNAGQSFSVTVTALNPANQTATNYTGTVSISSSDPAAVLPLSGPLTNGVGTFQVTLNSLNFQTVTATDAANSLTGTSSGIAVAEGTGLSPEPVPVGTDFGSQPVGTTSPPLGVSLTVAAGTTVGSFTVLTTGVAGKDFAYAAGGTCTASTYGTITTCTVNATFAPLAPGLRIGVVELLDPAGNLVSVAPIYGVGTGPLADFLTGTETKIGSGLNDPYGVTVDEAGNLYVADSNHNAVKEILAAGGYTTINTLGGGFSFPESVAVDGAGNVFVADYYNSAVKQIPPGCTTSSCVVTVGSGFSYPSGVAVDANGNVYVADTGSNAVKEIEAAGGYSTIDTLGSGFSSPTGVAVDLNGNVFVADYGNEAVKEILAAGGFTTVKTLGSGFVSPVGVSLDASDNVYVADLSNGTVNEIVAAGGYTTIHNVGAVPSPEGLTVDSFGNVFAVADHSSKVVKFDLADSPALTLAVSTLGTPSSDSPHSVIMENNGNEPLTIDVPSSGTNASISGAAFTLGAGAGSDCPQIAAGTSPGTLPAGSSCLLPVTFTPVLEGANTGAITVTDNTLNVDGTVQTVSLNGLGGDAIQVTVGTSVAGLEFGVDGNSYTTTQIFNWITGQQHTLASLGQSSADGETEYLVTGWSDGTRNAIDVITVTTGVTSFTAEFSPTYLLSVAPNVGAYGTATPVNYAFYAPGTVVNITATPTGGSFSNWTTTGNISDIASPTSPSTSITINSPEIVTANFVPLVGPLSSTGNFGSEPIGTATPPQAVTVSLLAGTTVGSFGVFTQGSTTLDFTMVSGGTCAAATYPTASSCTVNVVFNPIAAGLRQGAVVFFSGAGNSGLVVGNVPIYGTGTGPQILYSPSPQFTVPNSQTDFPIGVARDGAGDLFIASIGPGLGAGSVVEVPAGGGASFVVGTGWESPTGVAVDGAGDLFVADFYGGNLVELPVGGGAQFQVPYSGVPAGIAADASGNLYIADSELAQVVELAAGTGLQTQIGSGWFGPTGVAVDPAGNVYVVDESASTVTQVPAGTSTLNLLQGPATLSPTGWTDPVGVAVDDVGNVYVADESLGVVELAAGSFTPTTLFSPAITPAVPSGITVDPAGDVFVSDFLSNSEIELQRSNPSTVTFPTATPADTTDTTDGTKTVHLQNIGTSNLTFSAIGYPADFPMAIGDPNACSTSTPLAAGSMCDLPVTFAPVTVGSLSEDLTITDNALNGTAVQQLIPVSGIGKAVISALTYPSSGSLAGVSQLFTWNAGIGVSQYALRIGSTGAGSSNLYNGSATTAMSATVSSLPINGETVYVTLLSLVSGVWQSNNYTFNAFTGIAATLNPLSGGTSLGGISQLFSWSAGVGVTEYVLRIGTAGVGSTNLYNGPYTTNTSVTVNNLPINGEPVYVQLWSLTGGLWLYNDYTFSAFAGTAATLNPLSGGTTLGGVSQVFTWTAGAGDTKYALRVGSTGVGSANLYNGPYTTNTSATVSNLPINGEPIYVQLWSLTGGFWLYNNYTFSAFSGTAATLNPLSGGNTFSGISQLFAWTAGAGNTQYELRVGSTGAGSSNLYNGLETTNTSATISNLPINGETIYVRLFSLAGGFWLFNDYTFTAFTGTAATLNPLSGGTTLSGASQLFSWTPGAGDTQYELRIGSTGVGSGNLYNGPYTTNTSVTVTHLPTNGETVYVQLSSFTGGLWLYKNYTFTAY